MIDFLNSYVHILLSLCRQSSTSSTQSKDFPIMHNFRALDIVFLLKFDSIDMEITLSCTKIKVIIFAGILTPALAFMFL